VFSHDGDCLWADPSRWYEKLLVDVLNKIEGGSEDPLLFFCF
jgi:hypothetical protein